MAATTTFSNYVQRLRTQDPSVLLGSLIWYSVHENVRVPHTDLVDALTAVGLDDHQPPKPTDDDVFRRVCTGHQRKKVETDNPDVFENYLIRDVKKTDGEFVKQIVVEQVNAKGKKLGYNPAVQLAFTVGSTKIEITPISKRPSPQAANLAELIRRDFRAERGSLNAYGIREMFRKIVLGTGATVVRPTGGVYFVMESQRPTVEAMVALSQRIPGTTFHPVPLINDKEQQTMLRQAFESETVATVEKRLGEIDAMLSGPEITSRRYADLVAEMKQVKARTGEYREILDDKLANSDLILRSWDAKMKKLFLHVKGD